MKVRVATLVLAFSLVLVVFSAGASAECVTPTEGMVLGGNQTIELCAGTYSAANDSVFLTANASDLILDCNGASFVGNGNGTGIFLEGVESVTLLDCSFSGFDNAVYADDVVGLVILNSSFSDSEIGVEIRDLVRGKVQQSMFKDCERGLYVYDGFVLDVENTVFDGCGTGLQSIGLEASVFRRNEFLNNTVGLDVASSSLQVYRNLFKSDTNAVANGSTVEWSYLKEGNFWNDYNVSGDTDSDGLGNEPHTIYTPEGAVFGKDSYPFVSEDFSTAVQYSLEEREDVYEAMRRGHSVSFFCDGDIEYVLKLVDPSVREFTLANASFNMKTVESIDLDGNGPADINLFLLQDSLDSLDVKVVRLDDCVNYCGDSYCLSPETEETCSEDCVELDEDGDGVMRSEGDCNDADAAVYPGAKESCGVGVDKDCDGLAGDKDPDCQGMGFGFWFFLLLFLLASGGAAFLYFKHKGVFKGGVSSGETVKTPARASAAKPAAPKKTAGLGKIKGYAKRYLNQGMDTSAIKETLMAQGWPSDKISAALKELEGEM